MIAAIILFVKTKALLFRIIGTASVVAVAVGSCMLRDASLRKEGAAGVVATSKIEGKKNAENASKAYERARAPGAAERLRKDSCRDC